MSNGAQRRLPATPTRKNTLGYKLRMFRLEQELTQKDVADEVGINDSFVSLIEHNRREPTIKVLGKMCKVLRVKFDIVFTPCK